MPSLYKNVAVEPSGKVSIPVAEVKIAPEKLQAGDAAFEKAVEVMAEALLKEKWESAQMEIAMERGRLQAETEAAREKALAEATQQGYAAGMRQAHAEASKLMREVQDAYRTFELDRVQFIEASRQEIIGLVVTVAEQFMHEQMQRVPELLVNMVARAIQELVSRRRVCVFVHPTRVETVAAYSYLLPGTADGAEVIVRPDPSLEVDAFRVEDDSGAILASLTEHMKTMRQVLADA